MAVNRLGNHAHRKEEAHNLLKVVQILSHSLVTETIIFPPYKTFYFERFVCNSARDDFKLR